MSDCGCEVQAPGSARQRRVVGIALGLNAAMVVVGTITGILAQSSGLIADALDMLADASAYAIALLALERAMSFKQRAAEISGSILALLGAGVIVDALRRAFTTSDPEGWVMFVVAALSLAVNTTVLRLLRRYRDEEVHLRAAWIFTRADVIANLGVIAAGVLVLAIGSRIPDLVIGCAIGLYVLKEASEIWRNVDAEKARV